MKLRSLTLFASLVWAGASFAQTVPAVASRPVCWSVHFNADNAERLRTGEGKELFASLGPWLTAFAERNPSVPGDKLASISVDGFAPQAGGSDPFPFLADLRFLPGGGGLSRHFESISKKHQVPIEEVAGVPTIHFQHQGKEIWIAEVSDTRVVLGTSRALVESAVATGDASVPATVNPIPAEMLGGKVEIEPLLASNPALRDSQLLNLLPRVEFHLLSDGGQLDLHAEAQLDNERSAKRAARIIDGMTAALSLSDPNGVPWDERLALKQTGAQLALQLHLEPQEARKIFDSFAREIASKTTAGAPGE